MKQWIPCSFRIAVNRQLILHKLRKREVARLRFANSLYSFKAEGFPSNTARLEAICSILMSVRDHYIYNAKQCFMTSSWKLRHTYEMQSGSFEICFEAGNERAARWCACGCRRRKPLSVIMPKAPQLTVCQIMTAVELAYTLSFRFRFGRAWRIWLDFALEYRFGTLTFENLPASSVVLSGLSRDMTRRSNSGDFEHSHSGSVRQNMAHRALANDRSGGEEGGRGGLVSTSHSVI